MCWICSVIFKLKKIKSLVEQVDWLFMWKMTLHLPIMWLKYAKRRFSSHQDSIRKWYCQCCGQFFARVDENQNLNKVYHILQMICTQELSKHIKAFHLLQQLQNKAIINITHRKKEKWQIVSSDVLICNLLLCRLFGEVSKFCIVFYPGWKINFCTICILKTGWHFSMCH